MRATRTVRCRIVLAVALALVAPMSARGNAPQVDPDSPAGTEYQLPIERARDEASGGRTQGGSGANSGRAPLFGEGVGSDPRPGSASQSASGTGSARSTPRSSSQDEASVSVKAQVRTPATSGTELVALAGGAGGLLLLAGLAGLAWRRRTTQG